MKISLMTFCSISIVLGTGLIKSEVVLAADAYPSKPITLVVPFPPGGPTDTTARMFSDTMSRELGQPIVVRNEPGAGGVVGSASVARKPADGYTLLWGGTSSLVVAPAVSKSIQFNPITDFEAVGMAVRGPMLLVGRKDDHKPVDLKRLIDAAKSRQVTVGSAGNGSIGHLTAEIFKADYSVKILHVPYKGGAPALTDLLSGQIDLLFDTVPLLTPYIKSGKLIAYGIASESRHPDLPAVPTFNEATGQPLLSYSWFGLVAPKGTPKEIVKKLSTALVHATTDEALKKRINQLGLTPIGDSPEAFGQTIKQDLKKWTDAAEAAGVSL